MGAEDIENHSLTRPLVQTSGARAALDSRSLSLMASAASKGNTMADLLVRGLDEEVVRTLKARAAAHGRSAEADHPDILQRVLMKPRRHPLADVLPSLPALGTAALSARVPST